MAKIGDGYPSELFKLDMERLGIATKRKPAKVIDFTRYIDTNRSTNHYHKRIVKTIVWA